VIKPTEFSELKRTQRAVREITSDYDYCARVNLSAASTQSALCHTRHLTVWLLAMELITRNSIAKQLQADPRLKAFDDLPVEAILINGSKRIPLYKASIVYDLIRNPELTTKERN
jgi:hypothetical protein